MLYEKICNKLTEIETKNNIKILYACESGSRAWGFESFDSDFDIRFIYLDNINNYLTVFPVKDVIELYDNDLDFVGWDLKKALNLLYKSNPAILEWLNSNIVYKKDNNFFLKFKNLSLESCNLKSLMYHYWNMVRNNYRNYLKGEMVRLKKYFYVLRAIFCLLWIEKFKEMPPMEFEILFQKIELPDQIKVEVKKLLTKKKIQRELDLSPKIQELNEFIDAKTEYFKNVIKNAQQEKNYPNKSKFNKFFQDMVILSM